MISKKPFCLLLALAMLAPSPEAQAAPGDTTRGTVFRNRCIFRRGTSDTTAVLPASGHYRKILLHYVPGHYASPAGTQYGGLWGNTTHMQLLPDTLELARVITPYATDRLAGAEPAPCLLLSPPARYPAYLTT